MSWRKGMRPASYRGVSFETKGNSLSHGRRGTHHQYAGRDRGFVQDNGQADAQITLDAYVIGEDWITRRDALEAALLQPGAGTLIHPTRGALDVVPVPGMWSVRERSGAQRMAVFRLAFLHADDTPHFPVGDASPGASIRERSAVVRAAAIAGAAATLNVSGPDWIAADAAAETAALVDEITGIAPIAAGSVGADAADAVASSGFAADSATATVFMERARAAGLTGADLQADGWRAFVTAFAGAALVGIETAFALRDLFQVALRVQAMIDEVFYRDASDGSRTLRSAGGAWAGAIRLLAVAEPVQDEDSISGARRAANARALHRLVRLGAVSVACEAAIGRAYESTRQAIGAMQTLDREIETIILREAAADDVSSAAVVRDLTDLRAVTREALLGSVADIVPIATRDVPRSLPSLALAWRLTAGIESEADIVARNGIGHAMFCPAGATEYRVEV